jgi:hypothetical protein
MRYKGRERKCSPMAMHMKEVLSKVSRKGLARTHLDMAGCIKDACSLACALDKDARHGRMETFWKEHLSMAVLTANAL